MHAVAQHAQVGIEFVEQLTQLHKHAQGNLGYAPNPEKLCSEIVSEAISGSKMALNVSYNPV